MRRLWNWFRGTNKVWIEMRVIDHVELIKRLVYVHPFGGLYAYQYDALRHGLITLTADGKGTCNTGYTEILRWASVGNRPLRAKYQMALAIGEIDRKWKGDR